jgi:DNA-binding CsgD family transcriptional regulator
VRTQRPSALAGAARCRALLADEHVLDACFGEALAADEDVTGPFERARTQLLYGERLAGADRLDEARERLATALMTFERLGAEPWAARARAGIRVAGGTPPERRTSPLDRLTPRELEVALATVEGASVREVASRLFMGPRTAQRHLATAIVKLGLESPAELRGLLLLQAVPAPGAAPRPSSPSPHRGP